MKLRNWSSYIKYHFIESFCSTTLLVLDYWYTSFVVQTEKYIHKLKCQRKNCLHWFINMNIFSKHTTHVPPTNIIYELSKNELQFDTNIFQTVSDFLNTNGWSIVSLKDILKDKPDLIIEISRSTSIQFGSE